MAVWVIRAGKDGKNEDFALDKGVYSVGPGVNQSVLEFVDLKALKSSIREQSSLADELWRFACEMEMGELVVLPRKQKPRMVAVGRITGDYVYCYVDRCDESYAPLPHTRRVKWLAKEVPIDSFDDDLQKSFKHSQSNVVRVRRNNPETRIKQVVETYFCRVAECS